MGGGRLALFSRRRKCRCCCAFLESDMVLVVQVRSSVKCTPRNLVLLTLSTVELSMVSGGWSVEFLLLKSITTSFVFSTFRDRLLAPHHSASCATSFLWKWHISALELRMRIGWSSLKNKLFKRYLSIRNNIHGAIHFRFCC